MASRHVKQGQPSSRLIVVIAMTFVGLVLAAGGAAIVVHVAGSGGAPARAQEAPAPAVQQPVSQEGRIVAVSPTSVTAQSVDGFARTYLVTSETTAITEHGALIGGAGTTFAVNDEVSIVGVVRDGRAVATAVAEKQVSNLNGPPMDAV